MNAEPKKYPYEYVKYRVDPESKIATVTLSNPGKRNAAPFWGEEQLVAAIDDWEKNDDVKVVVIRGEGDHFCGGHDLEGYFDGFGTRSKTNERGLPNRHQLTLQRDLRQVWRRLFFSLKPTIAQISGHCIELGNQLQACCDISIAAEDAHIGNLGQVGGISGITLIRLYAHLIGYKRTREMMVCGRTWSGREASLIGLVNRAVPGDKVADEAMNEARRIALLPIDGIVSGKAYSHLVWEAMGMGQAFTELYVGHTLGLKLRFEEGDFAFFKEVRRNGASAAVAKRRELYAPLGGFGPDAELGIVPRGHGEL
ncbi:MAG: enoyl-CoA hydratase/isomerase family protein [Burkholderiales bacterium]|nr:enoyl-CoA hydratase/isomerase family protein [Burkholderiales bacterium]MCW5606081.1 enoyl-CoA hydratase/isomerase family protein [Burkholderiales bacterium]